MLDPLAFGAVEKKEPSSFQQINPATFGATEKDVTGGPLEARAEEKPTDVTDDTGFGDKLQRQLGLTARAGIQGITALPSLLAEPIRLGLNIIPGVEIMPSQAAVSQLLTSAGVPSPETRQERIVGGTAEALAGAAAPIGAGASLIEIAPTISKVLMASPSLQALSAAAGGATMQAAKEEGATPGEQLGLGMAASIAAPTAAGIVKGTINAARQPYFAIKSALTEAPKVRAEQNLAKALQDDSLSVKNAVNQLKEIGPEAMISDLGENVSSLARRIESVPGLAKTIATKELTERQLNRNSRVNDAIKSALGNGDDFFRTMDDINFVRKTAAAPKYEKAYQQPITMTKELNKLFDSPDVLSAWNKAKKIAQNEGYNLPSKPGLIKYSATLGAVKSQKTSTKTLDYVKRGLDDVIASHTDDFGRIKTDLGRSIVGVKKRLVDAIDKQNTDYKEARNIFAGHSANLDAMNKGRGFLNDDSEITSSILKSMTSSEKEMFRIGAARTIRDKILSAPDGGDAYKRIFGNDLIRGKLKKVFPNEKSYTDFARSMEAEKIMTATKQKVTGGSPTQRIAAEQEPGAFDGQTAVDIARGNMMTAIVNKTKDLLEKARTPTDDVSSQLAEMLFTRDPEANIKILKGLEETMKSLPQKQQESFAKTIIRAMAAQQSTIAAQVEQNNEQ